MELTKEQAAEAIKVDASREAIVNTLQENGFWIKSKDEKETFLNEERVRVREEVVNKIKGETFGDIDTQLLSAFDVKKAEGEKTSDYAIRIVNNFKEKASEVDNLKSKISTLETQLKDGSGDETLKTQLSTSQQRIAALEKDLAERDKTISDKDSALFKSDVGNDIAMAMGGIKFKKDLPDSVLKSYTETVRNGLIARAKKQGDKIVYMKTDNSDLVELDDQSKEASSEYPLKTLLKDVIDTGVNGKGAGTGDKGGKKTDVSLETIGDAKSQRDVTNALLKAGYVAGSKEYMEKHTQYVKELGLEKQIGLNI